MGPSARAQAGPPVNVSPVLGAEKEQGEEARFFAGVVPGGRAQRAAREPAAAAAQGEWSGARHVAASPDGKQEVQAAAQDEPEREWVAGTPAGIAAEAVVGSAAGRVDRLVAAGVGRRAPLD